jgi:CHAD domain-containing protein
MGKKEQKAACLFGATFLLEQLIILENTIESALDPVDIEPIHRLRVTSRRLRTGIKHFQDCLPEKKTQGFEDQIRRLAHTLGKARDLDIQIETLDGLNDDNLDENFKPGYRRLLLRLTQRRMKAQKKVSLTLSEFQQNNGIQKMKTRLEDSATGSEDFYLYTPSLYERAFTAINRELEDFISYGKFVHTPDNMEKLHAMRIAGKHLRYSLEIFAPIYQEALLPHIKIMKEIQGQLGNMHDDDVWVTWLPKFIRKEAERVEEYFGNTDALNALLPGFEHLIEDRKESREAAYQSFLITWETLSHENAWENLREVINTPVNIEAAMAFRAKEDATPRNQPAETHANKPHETPAPNGNGLNGAQSDRPPTITNKPNI